mgnify:CR=1 FL=1
MSGHGSSNAYVSDSGGGGTDSDLGAEDMGEGIWIQITNLEGHTFYRHIPTGDTRWTLPDGPITQHWKSYRNEHGQLFLHHAPTHSTREYISCMRHAGDGDGTASDKERDQQNLRSWKQAMKSGRSRSPKWGLVNGMLTGAVSGVKSVLSKIGTYTMEKASGVKDLVTDIYAAEKEMNAEFQAALREEAAAQEAERHLQMLQRQAAEDELRLRRHRAAQRQGPPAEQQYHHHATHTHQSSSAPAGQAAGWDAAASAPAQYADAPLRPRLLSYDSDVAPAPPMPHDPGPPKLGVVLPRAPVQQHHTPEVMAPLVLGWNRTTQGRYHVPASESAARGQLRDSSLSPIPNTGRDAALLYSATDTETGGMSNAELEV